MLEKRATKFDGRSKVRRLEIIGGVTREWVRKVEEGKWVGAKADGDSGGGVKWNKEAYCGWDEGWDGEEEEEDWS